MLTPDEAEASLQEAIPAALPDLFLNRWALLYEVVETNGDRALYSATSEDLRSWEILGMLRHAQVRWEACAVEADEDD